MARRAVRLSCLIAVMVAGLAAPSLAQTRPNRRFAVSGAVGVFFPRDDTMSAVYGEGLIPVVTQLDIRLSPVLSVFGGYKWLHADGHTIVEAGSPSGGDRLATSLTVHTMRFGLTAATRLSKRWALVGGGGIGIAHYGESLPDAGQEASGWATGPFGQAELRYSAGRQWGVFSRFEYCWLSAHTTGTMSVNLGGSEAQFGVRFAF